MKKRKIKKFQILIMLWLIASLWGAINIFSASSIDYIINGLYPYRPLISQVLLIFVCFIIFTIVLSWRKPPYLIGKKGAVTFFNITLVLLVIVLVGGMIFPVEGYFIRGGAKSTIPLPFISIQPLELYKITMILYMAKRFSTPKIYRSKDGIHKTILMSLIGIFLIFIEPDLGGALLVGGVFVAMIFYNGQRIKSILKVGVPFIAIAMLLLGTLSASYQTDRISAWLHPFENGNDLDKSYNVVQGYVAISNGGVLGRGYMESIQKSGFLFASHTDFIFTVIAEEWGLLGVVFTILILMLLAFQCFNIGYTAHERFGMLYCYGYGTLILVQAFINIGGVIGLIPMTGVTLPFISMGMNSFLILSLGLLYVIVIDKERIRQKKLRDEKTSKLFMS